MTDSDREKIENMPTDQDWYRCVKCRELAFAPRENFISIVKIREGRCLECMPTVKKKEKKKRNTHTLVCEVCDREFEGMSAKTCSSGCRRKYREQRDFL